MNDVLRLLAVTLLISGPALAGDITFHSGPGKVHLLELFTSEGCSSCPPAEERMSGLVRDPGLWTAVVPVSFHVDYWDYLGWPDRFASPLFTRRQQSYVSTWGGDSAYTPEFVLDGREFRSGEIPAPSRSEGSLTAKLGDGRWLSVRYEPAETGHGAAWEAHIATLGMGLETDVRAGENGGRRLRHDFVVLWLGSVPLNPSSNSATLKLPAPRDGEKAIAVWIAQGGQATPVQAAGGWLR